MQFSIGDQVRYLNDVGGGVIVKIIDNSLVEIRDENGFDIPVLASELVRIGSAPQQNTPEQQASALTEQIADIKTTHDTEDITGNDTPNLLFAFVPTNGNVLSDTFDIFLINDCNYHFLFTVHSLIRNTLTIADAGVADANTKILIGTWAKSELAKLSSFSIQGVYYKKKQEGYLPPVQESIKFTPVKLSKPGSFKENDFFESPALLFPIGGDTFEEAIANIPEKELQAIASQDMAKRPRIKKVKPEKEQTREIDLHIHELVDDESGLTPGDILDLQITHFKKELDKAIVDRVKKIVFIHGVGQGVLKMKIRSILDRDYKKHQYQDASFAQYKFGATLVEI